MIVTVLAAFAIGEAGVSLQPRLGFKLARCLWHVNRMLQNASKGLIKMCLKFKRSVVRLGLTSLVSCQRFSQLTTLRHKVWTRRYCWAGRGAGDAGDFSETPTFQLWKPCDCETLMKICKYCSKSIKIYFWKQGIPKDCQASTELATASTLLAPGTGEPWVMWCGPWVYEGSNDDQICPYMSIAYHFFWLI